MLSSIFKPNKEANMENEEIVVLDDGYDSPIGPLAFCCAGVFAPFRSM